jgi:hypothetical protein
MTMSARVLAPALLLVALATGTAYGATTTAAERSCSSRYHVALKAIEADEYAALKAARTIAFKGDGAMPGALVFTPPGPPRSAEETAALKEAGGLARGRGRPSWLASADSRWLADRVTSELGDYLSQAETPFLCSGVGDYLGLLRAQIARIGGGATDGASLVAAQTAATRQAIRAFEAALRPVPAPRYAPPLRNLLLSIVDFRPARGLERIRGLDPMVTHSTDKDYQGPRIDPDLPPLAMNAVALATDSDRLAAIEKLVTRAKQEGLMAPPAEEKVQGPDRAANPLEPRPVIERLAALQSAISGTKGAASEAPARRALVAALSAIEVLDYLAHRPAPGEDPMLAAIEHTFAAIEAAHAAACDCTARTAARED